MFRWLIAISLALCAPVLAQQQPTTCAVADSLTPAQLQEMHLQAVALMGGKNDFAKGAAMLHRVYLQTPVEERSRALVINHAIVDLIQRTNVARGVHDLAAWLTAHPGDELAINLLGASLNLMAERYDGKRKPAWQSAERFWESETDRLERSRPGMHRWGTQWYDEHEWAKIQFTLDRAATALRDQQDRIDQAQVPLRLANEERDSIDAGINPPGHTSSAWANSGRMRPVPRMSGVAAPVSRTDQFGTTSATDYGLLQLDMQRLDRHTLPALQQRVAEEQAKLKEMQAQQPRPEWPTRFDLVDPNSSAATQPIKAEASTRPADALGNPH